MGTARNASYLSSASAVKLLNLGLVRLARERDGLLFLCGPAGHAFAQLKLDRTHDLAVARARGAERQFVVLLAIKIDKARVCAGQADHHIDDMGEKLVQLQVAADMLGHLV